VRSFDQRDGPPGALPVKPSPRKASSFAVRAGASAFEIIEVKPTWSSRPSSL
jgi:hypothetical protein